MDDPVNPAASDPNPYQSPLTDAEAIQLISGTEVRRLPFGGTLAKWTLICGVSAAPSFYLGSDFGEYPECYWAMATGIVIFILAYTVVERSPIYAKVCRPQALRYALWLGYGLRVALSVVFPAGLFLDLFTGVVAVSITENLLSIGSIRHSGFGVILFTTLVQGTLMNILLGGMVLIFWALITWWMWLAARSNF